MKKTLFVSLLLVTFVLSACEAGPEANQDDNSTPVTEENPVESALDTDTIVNAVRMRNIELCGTLSGDASQKNCKLKVEDAIILDAVGEGVELNDCKKIKEEKTMDQCEILVKANQKKAEQTASAKKDQENVDKIVASGDVSDCESLEQENYRLQCESNIYMSQAAEQNDPAPCKKIDNDFLQESCFSQLTQ